MQAVSHSPTGEALAWASAELRADAMIALHAFEAQPRALGFVAAELFHQVATKVDVLDVCVPLCKFCH